MLRSLCILGAASLCLMVRNDRLPDCPFVASIKERLPELPAEITLKPYGDPRNVMISR